ncbi:TPA: hypothetical protein QDZ42_002423 [Stenotrophomonas maltophilia]|nr:hypothetical protein [Stenotrophomonas maltophilia]HDS1043757.1 hypothetical protein [Stenotrophomonas maltophilia]
MTELLQLVEPLINETWVVDGKALHTRPDDVSALYIAPLVHQRGATWPNVKILHSVLLDNNVLIDLLQDRQPSDNQYVLELFRTTPLEFNPVMALIEKRQGFAGASESVHQLADLLAKHYGSEAAKVNAVEFDRILERGKEDISANLDLLSGYIPAIIYLHHLPGSAESKIEWLAGIISANDLPYMQIPFYLAALLFLVKEKPELFPGKVVTKVTRDTKLQPSMELQKKAALNLAYDVMLPATALFTAGLSETVVVPYIATRDYLLQELLNQITCDAIVALPDGRANGAWQLKPSGHLHAHLAQAITAHMPRRAGPGSESEMAVRRARMRAVGDSYLAKCLDLKACA